MWAQIETVDRAIVGVNAAGAYRVFGIQNLRLFFSHPRFNIWIGSRLSPRHDSSGNLDGHANA